MTKEVELSVSGSIVNINLGDIARDVDVEGRVKEVLPLLVSLLRADRAWLSLTEQEQISRFRARAAADLGVQAVLSIALARANVLGAIIDGSESIADHGFPEFLD